MNLHKCFAHIKMLPYGMYFSGKVRQLLHAKKFPVCYCLMLNYIMCIIE